MTYKTSTDHTFFGLFRNLNNLEVLDLSNNNLDLTGKKNIFPLLSIVDNLGVDEYVYGYEQRSILPCLRLINFNNNPITTIERHLFHGLRESNLQEISLQNCQLKHINTSITQNHYINNVCTTYLKLFQMPSNI